MFIFISHTDQFESKTQTKDCLLSALGFLERTREINHNCCTWNCKNRTFRDKALNFFSRFHECDRIYSKFLTPESENIVKLLNPAPASTETYHFLPNHRVEKSLTTTTTRSPHSQTLRGAPSPGAQFNWKKIITKIITKVQFDFFIVTF